MATNSLVGEFESAIRAMRVLREQKLQEVQQIEQNIANFEAMLQGMPEVQARLAALGETDDRYVGMSIPKAAAHFLAEGKGEPATTKEIATALLKGGVKTSSKNFEATLYTLLRESTAPKFRRTPDGRGWWLAEERLPNAAWGPEGQAPPAPKTRSKGSH